MIKLKESETFQRKIRQDDPVDLAISTWDLVRGAMKAGKIDEALNFMDYAISESKRVHDGVAARVNATLTYLASLGEEGLEKYFRQEYVGSAQRGMSRTLEELLQSYIELGRGRLSGITVIEEPDRYVLKYDPCGSAGQLMRTRDVARTKKAYPWSWGKRGIAYYCCHCCVAFEILPIEARGYPIKVILPPDKPEDPCVQFFYKKPESIPEEYFTRLGKTKTIK